MTNLKILERITGACTPSRNNKLTGANYPYRSAEPCALTVTETGAEGTGEFLPVAVELPGWKWELSTLVKEAV